MNSLTSCKKQLRAKEFSARELTQSFLKKIEEAQPLADSNFRNSRLSIVPSRVDDYDSTIFCFDE